MAPRGALHVIHSSLILGTQLDDLDYRLFLSEFHRDFRSRHEGIDADPFSPGRVLDELIPEHEEDCAEEIAGSRARVLRSFARRVHRLDLNLTGSDFGPFEQRNSPYSFDRASYHLGHELVTAPLKMEFPGYNAYRSTRQWDLDFVSENLDSVIELLPDYLWWSIHDKRDAIAEALSPDSIQDVTSRIESAGYKIENFGLYLTTLETLHMQGEDISL